MNESVAFGQFVVKVHSRCDLACDTCYVYEHADQSWSRRPRVMSPETARKTAERIAEHAAEHGLPEVQIILHGGEPLLAGVERLGEIIRMFRSVLDGVCTTKLLVHTNGTMLDRRFCEVFQEHRVKVGVSLDGYREANDRHRRYANGRGSYDRVVPNISLLREEYPDLYLGLLCTIDLVNDAPRVYEELLSHGPPSLNFLLPHATWDSPPPGEGPDAYADWLIKIFDPWYEAGRPVPIVLFDSILGTLRGRSSGAEAHGLDPDDVIVVETDGEIEQADSLKTAFDGAPATGYDVFTHPFDLAAGHPEVIARRKGLAGLAPECRSCPVVATCGGGMVAHRFGRGRGFANPSVYCGALKKLIGHIADVTAVPLPLSQFDALAAGEGDSAALAELTAGQRVIRRVLLAHVVRGRRDLGALLEKADSTSRAALTSVCDHPAFRAWAVRYLVTGADPERLPSYVAAITTRAGLASELELPCAEGRVHLPTIGSYDAGPAAAVTVGIHDRRCELPGAVLRPTPVLVADGYTVRLEDSDPDRARPGWTLTEALSTEELSTWRELFRKAWEILRHDSPRHAAGIRSTVTTLIPLAEPVEGMRVATDPHLFGALGLVRSEDPESFSELLVRGHQALKLAAVHDLVALHDGSDPGFGRRLEAAYAGLALDGARPETAELATASCLTRAGRRFVSGMRDAEASR